MSTEEILTSRIVMNEYLKSITQFDSDLKELKEETITDYCLMKDKYVF